MWVTTIIIKHSKDMTLASLAKKYQLTFLGNPVSFVHEKDAVIVNFAGIVRGIKKNIDTCIKALKKEAVVLSLEYENNFSLLTIKEKVFTRSLYSIDVFFVEPVRVEKDGTITITIGAYKKEQLQEIIQEFQNNRSIVLQKIVRKKIANVGIVKIQPELSSLQKEALDLAIQHGYYNYPREVTLTQLATIANKSYSTFQAHIRKAEMKYFAQKRR